MVAVSLYEKLGGDPAIEAALDIFYEKVMADSALRGFFENVAVDRIKRKQRAFLAMAFGGPSVYDGRDLRAAHHSAVKRGLDETLFNHFMGHFRATLEELGVNEGDISQVMAIAYSGQDDVLNR